MHGGARLPRLFQHIPRFLHSSFHWTDLYTLASRAASVRIRRSTAVGIQRKTASQKRQKHRAENEIAKPKCIFAPHAMQERFCFSPRHSLFPAHENAASVYKRPVYRKSAPSPNANAAQRRRAVGTGGKYKPLRFFSLVNKTGTRARSNRYFPPKKAASFSYKIPFLKMMSNFVGRTAPNRTRTMCRAYGARRQPALLPF